MFHQPCQLHDSLCHNGIGAVQVSYSSLFQKWRKGSLSEKTLNADSLSGTIFCSLLPIWPVFSDDHVLADSSLSADLPSLVPNLCAVLVAMNVVIWLMFHEARCLLLVCWCWTCCSFVSGHRYFGLLQKRISLVDAFTRVVHAKFVLTAKHWSLFLTKLVPRSDYSCPVLSLGLECQSVLLAGHFAFTHI